MANLLSVGTQSAGYFLDAILSSTGAPVPNTPVTVYQSDGSTLASLYTSQTKGAAGTNPLNTDAYGNLAFYADPGLYVLSFTVGGVASTKNVMVDPWYTDAAWNAIAVTAAYVANSGDSVLANTTTGAFTVTTPSPTLGARLLVTYTGTANNLTLTTPTGVIDGPTGSVTGIGTASLTINSTGQSLFLMADGTNWHLVGGAGGVTSFNTRSGAVTPGNADYLAVASGGLTGATAATRYVGGTTSGAPTTGTFAVGDFVIDQTGVVWICTTAGTPGTWTKAGAGAPGTTVESYISAGLTVSTTATAVTSVSLAAGTWFVIGRVSPSNGSTTGSPIVAAWLGPNSASTTGAYASSGAVALGEESGAYSFEIPLLVAKSITLAAAASVYLNAQAVGNNVTAESADGAVGIGNVTGITAVRTA